MGVLEHAYVVILAGGRGERFWPLSTSRRPKQFLRLIGGCSLLEQAVRRIRGVVPPERIFVITSADLAGLAREAASSLPRANVIGEPFGRDTAAAVALGLALVLARDPDGLLGVVTADQVIGDVPVFRRTLRESFCLAAERDVLITIGMKPRSPSTGFGYIEAGSRIRRDGGIEFFTAKRFVEKPDAARARRYLKAGRFFWNSGMFVWSAETLRKAFQEHRRPLFRMAQRLRPLAGTKRFAAALRREYGKLKRISIDYALMEKARNIVMAKGDFQWDDVGAWSALESHFRRDPGGNVLIGACAHADLRDSIVVSKERLTALIGIENVVVVQAPGATLICRKDRAQDVKQIVELLRSNPRYGRLL
jgi:mannose-1-phosphate guanylyltransferase